MRTTLSLDDQLLASLQELAQQRGQPFKKVVNEALRLGLNELEHPRPRDYRLPVAQMGEARPGVNLDKALTLANALEDDAIQRELEMRK